MTVAKKACDVTLLFLLLASCVVGQNASDACHVYMAAQSAEEVKTMQKLLDEVSDPKELERRLGEFVKNLGEFKTVVGEEQATTRSYAIPGTSQYVTVTVFYTDESMAAAGVGSDSMLLSLALAGRKLDTAQGASESAQAEISIGRFAGKFRLKRSAVLNGKEFLIGLECERKPSGATTTQK